MFNKEDNREQEHLDDEGLFADAPTDEYNQDDEFEYENIPERTESAGNVTVKYVGPGGSYKDNDGNVYKKREPVSVSSGKANELTSLRGGSIFVRTDS